MNEILFFSHIILVLLFVWGAVRLGKEALLCLVAVQAVLANLFVIKQMTLFGLTVTCSDVFAIGGILGLNLLQEFFGKESAKRAVWICFFIMIFFALMAQMHLLYHPCLDDWTQSAFATILSPTPRLLLASLATFCIVQRIDVGVYARLKETRLSLPARNLLSLTLSQLLDTALFSVLGLWGMVASLADIFLLSFLIKLCIILLMVPALSLVKKYARN